MKEARGPQTVALPAEARPLGVVVLDAHHVVRAGLSLLISARPDMDVLAEAGSSDEAIALLKRNRRRIGVVVLVGLSLPGQHDCLWLIRTIRDSYPYLKILACGTNGDKAVVSQALFAGADGYVDKTAEPDRFLSAIRRVSEGDTVLEGLPADALGHIAEVIYIQRAQQPVVTERERQVLSLAAGGLTSRQIGTRLGVQERTVTTHLDHIYRKLGVSSRVAAISAAIQLGLLPAAMVTA